MDHPWRPPPQLPPVPGNTTTNICPICSISHFPFCPPPPFIQNPSFHYSQPPIGYSPPFPHHHPFPNNPTSISNHYHYNSTDGGRPTWYGTNPSVNISPYDGIVDHKNNNDNHPYFRGGVASSSYGYDNGGIKRMKIGDTSRFPSDNERILKLIHDHGNAVNGDVGLKRRREQPYYGQPPVDVDNHNSQPPYYWSESKGHYGGSLEVGHGYCGQPPLPTSPPPPPPVDVPRNHGFEPHGSATQPPKQPSLFPVAVSSSVDASSGSAVFENQSSAAVYYTNSSSRHASSLSPAEEFHIRQSSSEKHTRDIQPYPLRRISSEKQDIIDASHIFKQPHRATRPDHFVIILRGLPGSGKSYLAKMLRDLEVENGGEAPRIHSMDEYFMIEVEKAEDSDLSKSSGSLRGKRQVTKTVMEYCYEPEMEEAYRASMLKAFKKTLDEGVYSFIIVDDRNLRVADFAQFWATAKRSGYEVYLVEASYKDPAGCAARNVHNFTLPDIQKMAGQWEEAPPLYLKMDIKSLLHGDGLVESGIQEVDMDMEDEDAIDASQESDVKMLHDETKALVDDFRSHDELKDVSVTNHQTEEVKDLSRSKWSNDFDAEEDEESGNKKNSSGALLGLVQAYSNKEAKSVCWGDQGGNVGFSISATRKTNTRSLVIGPGPGYNLKSNPLSEEEYIKPSRNAVEPRTQSVFQERIRAERESFKAVFDKRRQRIGGFNVDDE